MNYKLNLIDPEIGQSNFGQNTLSILAHEDGYSFCIAEHPNAKILRLADLKNSTQEAESPDSSAYEFFDLLNSNFQHKYILFPPVAFTLVPLEYFKPEQAEVWLHFNTRINEEDKIISRQIPSAGMAMVASINVNEYKKLLDMVPGAVFIPLQSVLIESFLRGNDEPLCERILMNGRGPFTDYILARGNKLLLASSYRTPAADDVLYYLIYLIEQLGLNPHEGFVSLSGNIVNKDETIARLHNFFSNEQVGLISLDLPGVTMLQPEIIAEYYPLIQSGFCE